MKLNEDVAPAGAAPTTPEWATIFLPTEVRILLVFYGVL